MGLAILLVALVPAAPLFAGAAKVQLPTTASTASDQSKAYLEFMRKGDWQAALDALGVATELSVPELDAKQCGELAQPLRKARRDYPVSPLLTEVAMHCAALQDQPAQADALAAELAGHYTVIFADRAGLSPWQPALALFEVEFDPLERALGLQFAHYAYEVSPERGSVLYRLSLRDKDGLEIWFYADIYRQWNRLFDKTDQSAYLRINYARNNFRHGTRHIDALAHWETSLARTDDAAERLHKRLRVTDDEEAPKVLVRLCAARGWTKECATDAVDALVESVDADDGEALVWMALAHALGRGAPANEQAALALLKRAGQRVRFAASWAFYARQMRVLNAEFAQSPSYRLAVGIASDADLPEAVVLAAELARVDGQHEQAIALLRSKAERHPGIRTALAEHLQLAAQPADSEAELQVALQTGWPHAAWLNSQALLASEQRVIRTKGLDQLVRAASMGSPEAMMELARRQMAGMETPIDKSEALALAWYAARLGLESARLEVAAWCFRLSEHEQCKGELRSKLLERMHRGGNTEASMLYWSILAQSTIVDTEGNKTGEQEVRDKLEALAGKLSEAWLLLSFAHGLSLEERERFLLKAVEHKVPSAESNLADTYWQQGKDEKALSLLQAMASPSALDLNNLAWMLCAYPQRATHDPQAGLPLAALAVKKVEWSAYIDTLATCEAAAGNFDRAVTSATRAWMTARSAGLTKSDLAFFEERVALFQAKERVDEDAESARD